MQRVGVALEYPKELPDNAPGWFSRKEWLPPSRDLKVLLADLKLCQKPKVAAEKWGSFSGLKCLFVEMELWPSWMKKQSLDPYDPNGWNGVWPNSSMVLFFEPGGVIKEHIEHWQELARSGADVEILGPCYSACTLIVAYVPKERLCFGAFATLQFHLAWDRETGKPSLDASLWMLKQYPREIYDWIMERGGVASMTIPNFFGASSPKFVENGLSPMRA
jgi:hypothetical protein